MTRNLLRAGALSCALLTSTALTTPAQAQLAREHRALDANGVDLTHGDFVMSLPEGSIGSVDTELALVRTGVWSSGRNGHQWDDIGFTREVSGATTTGYLVTVGTLAERFPATGGTLPSGSTLTGSDNSFTYYRADGTAIAFGDAGSGGYGPDSNYCTGDSAQGQCTLLPISVTSPDGKSVSLDWEVVSHCSGLPTEDHPLPCQYDARLAKVSNGFGYEIHFTHSTDTPGSGSTVPAWFQRTGATFHNSNVSGNPAQASVSYAYPATGVTQVTDTGGRVWRIAGSFNHVTALRRPGASSDTTVIGYDTSGAVSSITRDGVTTGYARSVSGSTATTVVTDALSHQSTAVSNLTLGRVTSLTDALSHTTSYQYDSYGRLTRVTAPEGDYTATSYDARGNVTEVRQVAKSGSGLADIVATASYDSSCTDYVTCNRPNSVTDARGNVTDYTYDSTHGGVLTETGPAVGGVRPQTRYGYTLGNGIYRLTSVSACASGAAATCVGTAAESRTVIGYHAAGNVASVERRDGTGALSAVTAATYDARGDVASVDGPLPGSADTTTYRTNAARQRVGTISPDPDGSGPLPRRAARTTYSVTTGLPTMQEAGTVAGASDTDWAAFSAAQATNVEYDANARPVVQRLVGGTTTYSLTQTGYDALGRTRCTAVRMNPAEFATSALPSDACTLDTEGSFGPDRITRTSYDDAGRVVRLEVGVGVAGVAADEVAATYTANGRQETLTDGAGNRTTYVYDGHDRAVRMRYPSLTQSAGISSTTDYEELAYDPAGNVVTQRLRDGTSIGYTYDALNRVTEKDPPGSDLSVTFGYDLLGQMTGASTSAQSLTFTYDALGRRRTETGPLATVTNAYDLAGRRTALTSSNSYVIGYDNRVTGEVSAVRDGGGAVVVGYGYDGLGRRTSLTRDNGTVTSWSYDAAGRLATLTDDAAGTAHDRSVTFSYNPAGQIVGRSDTNDAFAFTGLANQGVTDTHNGLNQVTATGSTLVSHDARGNTTAIGAGSYGYDSENHLTSGPGGTTLSYDPLGRLYRVTDGGSNRRFLYDGDQVMSVYGPSGNVTEFPVHGEEPNSPLLTYDNTGRAWSHPDERGSVVARSNDAGTVTAVNRYDEYGAPQGGSVTGLFGYTGQAWLPELGMYDYHARLYNPGPAGPRFMQTDPIGYMAGMNVYAAMRGDPINLSDPLGLEEDGTTIVSCDSVCRAKILAEDLERERTLQSVLGAMHAVLGSQFPLLAEDNITVVGQRPRTTRPLIRPPTLPVRLARTSEGRITVAAARNCDREIDEYAQVDGGVAGGTAIVGLEGLRLSREIEGNSARAIFRSIVRGLVEGGRNSYGVGIAIGIAYYLYETSSHRRIARGFSSFDCH